MMVDHTSAVGAAISICVTTSVTSGEGDHAADAVLLVHEVEPAVDLVEREAV